MSDDSSNIQYLGVFILGAFTVGGLTLFLVHHLAKQRRRVMWDHQEASKKAASIDSRRDTSQAAAIEQPPSESSPLPHDRHDVEKLMREESSEQDDFVPELLRPQPLSLPSLSSISDENVKLLIKDRIEAIDARAHRLEDWARSVASLISELSNFEASLPDDEQVTIRKIKEELKLSLREASITIIEDDTWNPKRQRAIIVDRVLEQGAEPRLVRSIEIGLIIKEEIISKQTVHLQIEQ